MTSHTHTHTLKDHTCEEKKSPRAGLAVRRSVREGPVAGGTSRKLD